MVYGDYLRMINIVRCYIGRMVWHQAELVLIAATIEALTSAKMEWNPRLLIPSRS